MKTETKKCIIVRYDETIKTPPFLTIKIDEVNVEKPISDEGGVKFATNLLKACSAKGYAFKFYTTSKKENKDYEIIVY